MNNQAKIAAHRFTHEKYCGTLGYHPIQAWDYEKDAPKVGFVCVGWCDAKSLPFRPQTQGRAAMLYKEPETKLARYSDESESVGAEEFWIHV